MSSASGNSTHSSRHESSSTGEVGGGGQAREEGYGDGHSARRNSVSLRRNSASSQKAMLRKQGVTSKSLTASSKRSWVLSSVFGAKAKRESASTSSSLESMTERPELDEAENDANGSEDISAATLGALITVSDTSVACLPNDLTT